MTHDLSALIPLRPHCGAALHGRTVFLYCDPCYACCACFDLPEGIELTLAEIYQRCPPPQWRLVSDWRPG